MDRCSRAESLPECTNDSGPDALPSKSSGNSGAFVESVGSVKVEAVDPEPVISLGRRRTATRKGKGSTGSQFMQMSVKMRGVSVQDAWTVLGNIEATTLLVRGIVEKHWYLEGDGGTGTIFLTAYTPKCTAPGEVKYAMHKRELKDDVSHLSVMRCVEGKYSKRYKLFITYLKVAPDEAFGESSCLVVRRWEYVLRNPNCRGPEDSKEAHKALVHRFRQLHVSETQVKRRIVDHLVEVNLRKSEQLRVNQRQSGTGKRETRPAVRRGKNSTGKSRHLVNCDEDSEGEDKTARNVKHRAEIVRRREDTVE